MATALYGIKNCDTMKKAFVWLGGQNIEYTFHDYKKEGVDERVLNQAINEHGWEAVINKRGTTWRNLPDTIQNDMDDAKAVTIACENPSIIKRPVLDIDGQYTVGFSADSYQQLLG